MGWLPVAIRIQGPHSCPEGEMGILFLGVFFCFYFLIQRLPANLSCLLIDSVDLGLLPLNQSVARGGEIPRLAVSSHLEQESVSTAVTMGGIDSTTTSITATRG